MIEEKLKMELKKGTIHVCVTIDETREEIETFFRAKRTRGLPALDFDFEGCIVQKQFSESQVSNRIKKLNIPWDKNKKFFCEKENYIFNFSGKKYFVFIPCNKLSVDFFVDGFIANQKNLYQDKSQYILIHNDLVNDFESWGNKKENCEKIENLKFQGVKKGWHLYKIFVLKNTDEIEKLIPHLKLKKGEKKRKNLDKK